MSRLQLSADEQLVLHDSALVGEGQRDRVVTDRLLTAREVAETLGVTAETVLRWTRLGELPAIRLPGTARGRLRYRRGDVDGWIEAHATAGDATEDVSPAPNATRRLGVSSVSSPVPPLNAATTEEE